MRTRAHVSAGFVITALAPNPLGLALSFFSHYILDLFAENPEELKVTIILELLIAAVVILFSILTGKYILILGVILANWADIIDKFRYYILKIPESFDCHQSYYPLFSSYRGINLLEIGSILLIMIVIICM